MMISMNDFLSGFVVVAVLVIKWFMIGVNV